MNFHRPYLLFLALVLSLSSLAQDYNYSLHNLGVEDGLSQNYIFTVERDINGFTWVATQGGIDRFDGNDIKNYRSIPGDISSISSSAVRIIHAGSEGSVWMGHEDGTVSRYNPTKDEVRRAFFVDGEDTTIIKSSITGITEFGDDLLITSSIDGLFRWQPKEGIFKRIDFRPENRVDRTQELKITSSGQVLVLSDSSLYLSSDLENWKSIHVEPADEFGSISNVTDLGRGFLLLSSFSTIYEVNINTSEVNVLDSPLEQIVDMEIDSRGNIWVTGFEYVARFNPNFPEKVFYPTKLQGLDIKLVKYFSDGMLWAGTTGSYGLFWFDPYPPFEFISSKSSGYGKIDMVSPMNIRKSRFSDSLIWVADLMTLVGYVPKSGQVTKIESPSGQLMDFFERSPNEIYLCIDKIGIKLVNTNTGDEKWIKHRYHHAYPYMMGSIRAVCHDDDNMVWLGDVGAVGIFDAQTEEFEAVIVDSVPALSSQTMCILQDSGGFMWFGRKNGLYRYNPKDQDLIKYELYDNTNIEVFALNQIGDYLWLGTKSFGAIRIDLKNSDLSNRGGLAFNSFSIEDGLPNDVVYGILEDHIGNVWLSTNKGLCRLDPMSGAVSNFDMEDGLQHNEFNFRAYCKDYDGRMYFGGIRGVSAFYPEEVSRDQRAPIVRITGIRVNASPLISDIHPNQIKNLELAHNENSLSFTSSVIHYRDPEANQLKYRIKELGNKWTEVGDDRIIRLFNLSPGTYTMQFAAANSHGIWNHEAHELTITILPPWWQTTIFRVILVVFIMLLIFGAFYGRTRYLIAQRKNLEDEIGTATKEIALQKEMIEQSLKDNEALLKEMHHRVKNNLTVLSGLLQLQENQVLDPEASQVLKDSINRINSIALIHQNLYQHEEMAHIMADEIVGELAQTVVDAQAKNDIDLEVKCESIELEISQAVPIAMIINELITNSCKYAFKDGERGKVGVSFSKASVPGHFQLDVWDSGPGLPKGFDLKEAKTMGLRLVYILSKQLYARYTFRYKPHSCFTFVIPKGTGDQPSKT